MQNATGRFVRCCPALRRLGSYSLSKFDLQITRELLTANQIQVLVVLPQFLARRSRIYTNQSCVSCRCFAPCKHTMSELAVSFGAL